MTDEIFDFDNPGGSVGRWSVYGTMRREQPVFRTVINGEPTVILFRYQDVHQVLASPAALVQPSANTFPEHIGTGPAAVFYRESLPHLDRPVHSRLRKVVTQALNPATVSRMADAVGKVIATHLDALTGKSRVDIVAGLAAPIPADIGCQMLHLPMEDAALLFGRVGDLNAIVSHQALSAEALARADDAAQFYFDYFDRMIAANADLPSDDLVGSMIQAEANGALSRTELAIALMGLFLASYHTTKTSIANIIYNLARHPDQWRLLVSQPELSERAWNEGLRYDSPVHFVHRYATEDFQLGAQHVPAGSRILTGLASANRDEQRFRHADRFDIAREEVSHLAFAFGAHFCLGSLLSRLEGKLLLQGLIQRFPNYHIAEEPEFAGDLTFPFIDRLVIDLNGMDS